MEFAVGAGADDYSDGGEEWQVTTPPDQLNVVLDALAQSLTNQRQLTVNGTITEANLTAITVNGITATVTGNRFSATVPLTEGANAVRAHAEDLAGNVADIVNAAKLASKLKLGVNAGHGICYTSIKDFAGLTEIDEFSIGHSIVSRAALVGIERAVREMVELVAGL